ncbi:hypothetical protein TRVL_08247 [Trypanosoma vivax]|nr:hypothetical protein TRVL_08247 [Trypanosoma vivax]
MQREPSSSNVLVYDSDDGRRERRENAALLAAQILSDENLERTARSRKKYRNRLKRLGGVYEELCRGVIPVIDNSRNKGKSNAGGRKLVEAGKRARSCEPQQWNASGVETSPLPGDVEGVRATFMVGKIIGCRSPLQRRNPSSSADSSLLTPPTSQSTPSQARDKSAAPRVTNSVESVAAMGVTQPPLDSNTRAGGGSPLHADLSPAELNAVELLACDTECVLPPHWLRGQEEFSPTVLYGAEEAAKARGHQMPATTAVEHTVKRALFLSTDNESVSQPRVPQEDTRSSEHTQYGTTPLTTLAATSVWDATLLRFNKLSQHRNFRHCTPLPC